MHCPVTAFEHASLDHCELDDIRIKGGADIRATTLTAIELLFRDPTDAFHQPHDPQIAAQYLALLAPAVLPRPTETFEQERSVAERLLARPIALIDDQPY